MEKLKHKSILRKHANSDLFQERQARVLEKGDRIYVGKRWGAEVWARVKSVSVHEGTVEVYIGRDTLKFRPGDTLTVWGRLGEGPRFEL